MIFWSRSEFKWRNRSYCCTVPPPGISKEVFSCYLWIWTERRLRWSPWRPAEPAGRPGGCRLGESWRPQTWRETKRRRFSISVVAQANIRLTLIFSELTNMAEIPRPWDLPSIHISSFSTFSLSSLLEMKELKLTVLMGRRMSLLNWLIN